MLKRMSEFDVRAGLKAVQARILAISDKRNAELKSFGPARLVAVSKTKEAPAILEAYEAGQRHFGENYVNELEGKSRNSLLSECTEIRWHFIGHLQTNKVKHVVRSPNLYMIETVDRESLAKTLNKVRGDETHTKLKVMVQVNTSGEKEKNGVEPEAVTPLVKYILDECPNLLFDGLMTIGRFGYDLSQGPNPDFICLTKCRETLCKDLALDWKNVNLSMGMSDDFEHAIELGSTNVRVGSSIFGFRPKKDEIKETS